MIDQPHFAARSVNATTLMDAAIIQVKGLWWGHDGGRLPAAA